MINELGFDNLLINKLRNFEEDIVFECAAKLIISDILHNNSALSYRLCDFIINNEDAAFRAQYTVNGEIQVMKSHEVKALQDKYMNKQKKSQRERNIPIKNGYTLMQIADEIILNEMRNEEKVIETFNSSQNNEEFPQELRKAVGSVALTDDDCKKIHKAFESVSSIDGKIDQQGIKKLLEGKTFLEWLWSAIGHRMYKSC